jgi:hypothetical protein
VCLDPKPSVDLKTNTCTNIASLEFITSICRVLCGIGLWRNRSPRKLKEDHLYERLGTAHRAFCNAIETASDISAAKCHFEMNVLQLSTGGTTACNKNLAIVFYVNLPPTKRTAFNNVRRLGRSSMYTDAISVRLRQGLLASADANLSNLGQLQRLARPENDADTFVTVPSQSAPSITIVPETRIDAPAASASLLLLLLLIAIGSDRIFNLTGFLRSALKNRKLSRSYEERDAMIKARAQLTAMYEQTTNGEAEAASSIEEESFPKKDKQTGQSDGEDSGGEQ